MTDPIKVACLGISAHAEEHILPNLKLIPTLSLDAISSRDQKKAERLANRFGARSIFTHWKDAVASEDIEAIIVTGPPKFHAEVVHASLLNGKHIFVEKPCASDTTELKALIEKSDQNPHLVTHVGYNFRQSDLFVQSLALAGSANHLRLAIIDFHTNKPRGTFWHYKDVLHSFLYGVAIHAIEMAAWILTDPKDIEVSVHRLSSQIVFITLTITNTTGQAVQLRLSNASTTFQFAYQFYTDAGKYIHARSTEPTKIQWSSLDTTATASVNLGWPTALSSEVKITRRNDDYCGLGYQRQLEAFSAAIRKGTAQAAPIKESLNSYLIIDRIIERA